MSEISVNKAIITTGYVVNQSSPILTVIHDSEDDWQFLGNEEVEETDAMVISIAQILEIDSTLTDILGLPVGAIAERTSVGAEWRVSQYEE